MRHDQSDERDDADHRRRRRHHDRVEHEQPQERACRGSMPSSAASSSPSISALSDLRGAEREAKHTAKHSATSVTPRQSAVVKVPRFQKVMLRACGSRAMYDRKPVPALQTAFTAMPASSSVNTFTLPNDDEMR